MIEQNSEQKQHIHKTKSDRTVSFESKIIPFIIGLLGIGCIGYFAMPGNWLGFIFAHIAALGIMGLLGSLAGKIGKKKGYGFWKAFLLGFALPISMGVITVFIVHSLGGRGCGGIVSITVAILVVAYYLFVKQKVIFIGFLFLIHLVFISCSKKNDFPLLKGSYLGQKPPGMTPEIFAPGIISTAHYEQGNSFSPDGKVFYYTLVGPRFGITLFMQMQHGRWSKPQTAPFSGKYNDYYPFYSPDGKRIYFVSMRPVSGQGEPRKDFDIWFVESIENHWSEPQNIGPPVNTESYELHPTVTNDGTLYFVSSRKGGKGRMDVYKSRLVDGLYLEPENLGGSINTEFAESNPYIATDESYLIFTSHDRPDGYGKYDLYISFRKTDGSWTKAKNMGNQMNSKGNESTPNLSHDGKYFFFTSARNSHGSYSESMVTYDHIKKMLNSPGNGRGDIYWVDAKIIEDLKPEGLK